jgi:hypothetical protein
MAGFAQARAMLNLFAKDLLSHPNVVAVGVGRKNGDPSRRDWCIRVHVRYKTKRRTSSSVDPVLRPPAGKRWLSTVPTDVVQTGRIFPHNGLFPLQAGNGLQISERGTCAALIKQGGTTYALTAGHVVSNDLTGFHNEPYGWIPAVDVFSGYEMSVDEQQTQVIGQCVRCSSDASPVDLALIQLDPAVPLKRSSDVTGIRDSVAEPLQPGERIQIVRRFMRGPLFVTYHPGADQNITTTITYRTNRGPQAVQYDGLLCYPGDGEGGSIQPGDSGAAVVDAQSRLIGIHIAGTEDPANNFGYGVSSSQLRSWAPGLTLY